VWITSSIETSLQPTQVALGNFDGVHLGHRAVIQALAESPSQGAVLEIDAGRGENQGSTATLAPIGHCYTTVVSFTPHPHVFFSGQPKPLLTLLPEKVEALEALGVEQLVLLPFDQDLANLTPEEFVEQVLVGQLKAQKISVGFNFCFGRNRAGTAEDLRAIAARYNIPVMIVEPAIMDHDRISSSAVRQALEAGDVVRAKQLLGRTYTLTGKVIQGQQLGRTLGFPTANLKVSAEKFIPHRGVYRVQVESSAFAQAQLGVMNIGSRPTVDGIHQTIEVHLLDWSGDLYGHTITVCLEQFLRPEQKFESLDALKDQIQLDCGIARASVSPIH
jgi:riboflavin kinase / FMN adenylyltransferase